MYVTVRMAFSHRLLVEGWYKYFSLIWLCAPLSQGLKVPVSLFAKLKASLTSHIKRGFHPAQGLIDMIPFCLTFAFPHVSN